MYAWWETAHPVGGSTDGECGVGRDDKQQEEGSGQTPARLRLYSDSRYRIPMDSAAWLGSCTAATATQASSRMLWT
ncbi:hypothetical protein CesoFtcFv8_025283 [Champsocephalus esox]|uniref:Uncharacterized protein n=1 Tax=Champsocephalus esox TaxID=159716 RepID=A0AAN8GGR2_9TELE|nr:hypothetical protein CesoFtcFv8_025283 [Champsocephalus esox]